jgi:hypothetical protein
MTTTRMMRTTSAMTVLSTKSMLSTMSTMRMMTRRIMTTMMMYALYPPCYMANMINSERERRMHKGGVEDM